jgi:hypothetical protein
MLTISPRRGALWQNTGAVIRFEGGESWASDYRTMRGADESVRFQIKNTFLPGADIVISGRRLPLLRFRGLFGRRQILRIGDSELEILEERFPMKVKISFGRWSAEYDESSFIMTVRVAKEDPELPFVLAGAHQMWMAQIGS